MWEQIKRWEISRNFVALFATNGFAESTLKRTHLNNKKFSCTICHKWFCKKLHFKEHTLKTRNSLALFATNGFAKKCNLQLIKNWILCCRSHLCRKMSNQAVWVEISMLSNHKKLMEIPLLWYMRLKYVAQWAQRCGAEVGPLCWAELSSA